MTIINTVCIEHYLQLITPIHRHKLYIFLVFSILFKIYTLFTGRTSNIILFLYTNYNHNRDQTH